MTAYRGFLAILFCAGMSLCASAVPQPFYIGWAQEAYPDYSSDVFLKDLKEQKKYGANLLWIGHNNPGSVDKNKFEPGLSYAVYEALQDQKSSLHADAVEQVAAVKRLLDAARREGFKTVLAVGYQIQMGPVWNSHHPEALRREHNGRIWEAGGVSASYLSTDYQHDIQEYYHWVDRQWVVPYKDVLVMLNLADEPYGSDFSASAEAAFKAETGMTFKEAGQTDAGMVEKGRFQNLYIVHYARWSAGVWKSIDPSIHVTMSFCGCHGRFANFQPDIAALFRDTPDNFDVTFDAFLIDNEVDKPIDAKYVSALAIFLRQLGELSTVYHKRVWLWPEANNWILSQGSPVKGNISDALFGVALLRNMSAAAGIQLGGLAVWNLDVKEQGLFRDSHPTIYDPQRMFDLISGDFKTPADPVRLRDDVLVWIPTSEADHLIGRKSYDYADRIYSLDLYGPLLERGLIPRLSSANEPSFDDVKTVFLVSKYEPLLSVKGYQRLDTFVQNGGTLITNYTVLRPASIWRRLVLFFQYYWNGVCASLSHQPSRLTMTWGKGKVVIVFGQINEKLRNIIRLFPTDVVEETVGKFDLPLDAGGQRDLLSFPQKQAWFFYNTNPKSMIVTLKRKLDGALVTPDGTLMTLKPDTSTVTIPHGAWLKLYNNDAR